VPKEALLKYLAEDGAVRLEEVTFGGKQPFDEAKLKQLEAEYKALKQHPIDDPSFGEQKYDELIRLMNIRDQSTVQSLYDEANRITQLAQQAQARGDNAMAQRYFRENEFLNVRAEKLDLENLGQAAPPRFGQYQQPGGENYREMSLVAPTADDWFDFPRGHRYSGGPEDLKRIAHMRLNERTDTAGRPGLFLEEIQSDRHQAGREKGYAGDPGGEQRKYDFAKQFYFEVWRPVQLGEITKPEAQKRWDAIGAEASKEGISKNDIQDTGARYGDFTATPDAAIPDAPFRKDWPVQMFKRALADAVSSGKEWIGWTTGETQAARYDLSKQISEVAYNNDSKSLFAYDKKGENVLFENSVSSEKIADYIGKEAAQRLLNAPKENSQGGVMQRLKGEDLKVGGEGMKGFYDQILPKEISKYVKQWGGQVEKGAIKSRAEPTTLDVVGRNGEILLTTDYESQAYQIARENPGSSVRQTKAKATTTPIWRVNITPQMRESIKKAGQALFVGGVAAVVAEEELR